MAAGARGPRKYVDLLHLSSSLETRSFSSSLNSTMPGASSIVQHAVELLLTAYQRIDMLDRGHIGVLGGDRALVFQWPRTKSGLRPLAQPPLRYQQKR